MTDGLRRVGARAAVPDADAAAAGGSAAGGGYAVGERVEHPLFGMGTVQRIETLATDHKLVVDFGKAGVKTLLAKFAKLKKC